MGLFRSAAKAVPEYGGDLCCRLWKGIDPQGHLILVADERCWNKIGSISRLPSSSEASLIKLPSSSMGRTFRQEKAEASPVLYLITAYHIL